MKIMNFMVDHSFNHHLIIMNMIHWCTPALGKSPGQVLTHGGFLCAAQDGNEDYEGDIGLPR